LVLTIQSQLELSQVLLLRITELIVTSSLRVAQECLFPSSSSSPAQRVAGVGVFLLYHHEPNKSSKPTIMDQGEGGGHEGFSKRTRLSRRTSLTL